MTFGQKIKTLLSQKTAEGVITHEVVKDLEKLSDELLHLLVSKKEH